LNSADSAKAPSSFFEGLMAFKLTSELRRKEATLDLQRSALHVIRSPATGQNEWELGIQALAAGGMP
jgi:hypothetical protein